MIRICEPAIGNAEIEEVTKVLKSGYLTNTRGGYVERFEEALAEYLGVKHVVAVSSGTAALHLALTGIQCQSVLVPAFSFRAIKNMAEVARKVIHYVDIDPRTYNMNVSKLRVRTIFGALVVVHSFGQSADMDQVMEFANRDGIHVIEDAACALGSRWRDRKCGTFGYVSCFSFHPRKIITTGEGGAVVTNQDWLADYARQYRNHGVRIPGSKMAEGRGYNYRMSEIHAAIGCVQIKKLDRMIERRRQIAALYNGIFEGSALVEPPLQAPNCFHIYQSYVVWIKRGTKKSTTSLIETLKEKGIETTVASQCWDYSKPHASSAEAQTLALPIHSRLGDAEAIKVAETLLEEVK